MNENKDDYCIHKWDSDSRVRLCFLCGQIRMFPNGDSNPRVLWPGRETKDDPLQLPKADKALIAGVAKRFGIKKAAKVIGIKMVILRAWVGAYYRKPNEPRGVHSVGTLPTPQPEGGKRRGRPKKPVIKQVEKEHLPITELLGKFLTPITLTEFYPGNCLICGENISLPGTAEDHKPCNIQTPGGKIWLCGVCTGGVVRVFEALGIPCRVITAKGCE